MCVVGGDEENTGWNECPPALLLKVAAKQMTWLACSSFPIDRQRSDGGTAVTLSSDAERLNKTVKAQPSRHP